MFNYFMSNYGNVLVMLIMTAIFGCLGYALKRLVTKYINDDTKRSIARTVVQYVEQIWKDIHGLDKLTKALEAAEALLKKKGIDFDASEMEILIEAAVAEFNEAFKKPLLDDATADAVQRVGFGTVTEDAEGSSETTLPY